MVTSLGHVYPFVRDNISPIGKFLTTFLSNFVVSFVFRLDGDGASALFHRNSVDGYPGIF
jgi:hypothetical protein